jgi:histidinol phosphatase-like enzyme (inositol monophosphatase family)
LSPSAYLPLAHRLADLAGEAIRPHFRAPLDPDDKADGSPVTLADRAAEEAMRQALAEAAPGHGIIGEEFGTEHGDAEWVWVLDPIDGTKAFLTGKPLFTTLIGLLHRGKPVLGIIDQVITGERWAGAAGEATTWCGKPVRVRGCAGLSEARLSTTGPDYFTAEGRAAFERVLGKVRLRSWGGDGYQYGLVASGGLDLVIEEGLKVHDWAALCPVIAGAGGVVSDWEGRALSVGGVGRVLAAGDGRCHAEAVALLGG